MSDINIRRIGQAGRITFTRPQALNALSYEMALAIDDALDLWVNDDAIKLIVIDAEGEKAFCAGGDIAEIYQTGIAKNYAYAHKFWTDEYRMNAKIADYPKPVVALMQGFVLGGGVGVGCHASHRIVGDSTQLAMPEVGIGLVPDVGGSFILAGAPGHVGEYLGLTASRIGASDAIYAGFADSYIPEENWPDLITSLETTADLSLIAQASQHIDAGPIAQISTDIDAIFKLDRPQDILAALSENSSEFAQKAAKALSRNSPLAMGCTLELVRKNRQATSPQEALQNEYRFTYRACEHGDFLEGIRAQIIDKDRNPQWHHTIDTLSPQTVSDMLAPLGAADLTF